MTVAIEQRGLEGAIKTLQGIADRARDMTPVLKVGAQMIVTAEDDRFRSGTDFADNAWKPDAPRTSERKHSNKVGIDTARLRTSMSATVVGRDTIRFGTNVDYAGPFAFGSHREGTLKRTARDAKQKAPAATRRGKRVDLHGPRRERAAGSRWSVDTPGRNPFPVGADGEWIATGPGAALLEKLNNAIAKYVATGKL